MTPTTYISKRRHDSPTFNGATAHPQAPALQPVWRLMHTQLALCTQEGVRWPTLFFGCLPAAQNPYARAALLIAVERLLGNGRLTRMRNKPSQLQLPEGHTRLQPVCSACPSGGCPAQHHAGAATPVCTHTAVAARQPIHILPGTQEGEERAAPQEPTGCTSRASSLSQDQTRWLHLFSQPMTKPPTHAAS